MTKDQSILRLHVQHPQDDQVLDVDQPDGAVVVVDDGKLVDAGRPHDTDGFAGQLLAADPLGIAGHQVADRPLEGGAVVVGDGPAEVTVGEDAADLAGVVYQDYGAAAAFDRAHLVQNLPDGQPVRRHRQVLAPPERHRVLHFDEPASDLPGRVIQREL